MTRGTDSIPMHAEAAYFFRHGALRDAAYQLIPISGRSRMHGLTLDILEESLGASLDGTAELAEHARLAQVGAALAGTGLPMRELRYLRLAALHAAAKFQNEEACRLWERVAGHTGAAESERCEALAEAGVTHWMLGRAPDALRCLSAAIGERKAEPRRLAFCLIERGTLHRDLRDYTQATRDLQEALQLARRAGDQHLQLRALGNLCTTQDENLTQTGVRQLYAPVIKLAREIGDSRALGVTQGQIGLACIRGHEFAQAEQALLESIRLLREAGDLLNVAAMLSALGRLFRDRTDGDRRANLARAALHYEQALQAKEQLGFIFQKSEALTGLASVHREQGMLVQAEKHAREALRLSLEVGDPDAVAAAYLELGAVQQASGDAAMAERTYSYGLVAVEASGGDGMKFELLDALARLLAAQGAWEDAAAHAQSAVDCAARTADTRLAVRAAGLLKILNDR